MEQGPRTKNHGSGLSPAPETTIDGELEARPRSSLEALVGNLREPIRLTGVNLCGVAAQSARARDNVKVWTRLALTSDDPMFHRMVENLDLALTHFAQQAGAAVNLGCANTVLLVIRPDETAELWIDAAAISLKVMTKRDVVAGSIVFENDIADVVGMGFPLAQIGPQDRVVCLFRQDWRFALFFDFNPDRDLDLDAATRTLGTLYRKLKYRHLYDTVADQAVFDRLVASGWFPFVEIIGSEFRRLAASCEACFDLAEEEVKLVAKFDHDRLGRILSRWIAKPHFAPKAPILKAAVKAFEVEDPIAVIKIILTEIEGVLAEAYRAAYGKGAQIKKLLEFATSSAEQKAGGPDTLLLPAAFAQYLAAYTFANFDPSSPVRTAGSRHAVGHGAADAGSYTQARALQALLTLDQIAFYT
jgi:hypothetical protein